MLPKARANSKNVTVNVEDSSADFNIESDGKPLGVIVDPNYKLLRISDDLRISSVARRGIEQFKEGNYAEAQQQFEAALKFDRSNSWIYYHLGLLFLEQRNYDLAIDNLKAVENLGKKARRVRRGCLSGRRSKWATLRCERRPHTRRRRLQTRRRLGDNYDNAQEAVKLYLARHTIRANKARQRLNKL